jgi:DNA-binding NarL/FixJ family response regulator
MQVNQEQADELRLVIVEDHTMIAEGLRFALRRRGMKVAAMAPSIEVGVEAVATVAPDVVLMDYRLPDGEAPEGIEQLLHRRPSVKILVLSGSADQRSVRRSLEAGASGYLLKEQPLDDLVAAIWAVNRGEQVLSPGLLSAMLVRMSRPGTGSGRLSPRETEVLQLLAGGTTTAVVARELHLSINTVRNHIQAVLTRLGAHSKLEAVAIAIKDGILPPPSN